MDLVCVGDNVADYYPEKKMLYPGGSAFNVAVLAGRYGLETAYVGTFGTDIAGKYQLKVLKNEGVNSSHITIREGINAFSTIINGDGQSEVIKVDKGVYKEFSLSRGELNFIGRFKYLHSTIYSYTGKYLSQFKESGLVISFDYSFKSSDEYIRETAPYVDIAFFSGEDIKIDVKEFMLSVSNLGPEYVIVTLGEKGVLVLYDREFYYQSTPQIEVVDTLGAGDTFIAMFLSCFIKGLALPEVLIKSCKMAAECCKSYGAFGQGKQVGDHFHQNH